MSHSILGFFSYWTAWATGSKSSIFAEVRGSPSGFSARLVTKKHHNDLLADHDVNLVKEFPVGNQAKESESIILNVQNFVKRVLEDREPLATGIDGKKALELCLATELSIHDGEVVKLPLKETPEFIVQEIAPADYPYLSSP